MALEKTDIVAKLEAAMQALTYEDEALKYRYDASHDIRRALRSVMHTLAETLDYLDHRGIRI